MYKFGEITMIKNYVKLDNTGVYPVEAGANFTIPEGAIEVDWDSFKYKFYMRVDGVWTLRPEINEPTISNMGVVCFENLPIGSIIEIFDLETKSIITTTQDSTFQLVDPATYEVNVITPLPWLDWNGRITCL